MQTWWKRWLGALILVWNKQIKFPLPEKIRVFGKKGGEAYEMAAFPLLGFLGSLLVILPGLLGLMIFNRFGGAMLFALVTWVIWLLHDCGRGDGLISSWVTKLLPESDIPYHFLLPVVMLIVKLAMLTALFFYDRFVFLSIIWAGGLGLEALLIRDAELPVMDFSVSAARRFWIVVLLVLLINIIFLPFCTALGGLFFMIWWKVARERIRETSNMTDEIRFSGAVCSWILLIAGVLSI